MNASASALTREDEVESKIRKVRKFGRNARAVCAVILGLGLVVFAIVLLFGVLGPGPDSGIGVAGLKRVTTAQFTAAQFTAAQLNTPELKAWMFLVAGAVIGVGLTAVYQLFRVFGNLAAGSILTPENVRRLRLVGVLWVLWTLLGIVIPFMAAMLVSLGFFLPSRPSNIELELSLSESFSSFVGAGLILLVSWIMDVGLYEKEHADALRRDADLVI